MQFQRKFPLVIASSFLVLALAHHSAYAATYTVSNLNDSGEGSLRQALQTADADSEADTVKFKSGLTGTLMLTSGELTVSHDINIAGPGTANLAISGSGANRIFNIVVGKVAISGLTLTNGAVLGSSGTGNVGTSGADASGGAVFNSGTLNLTDVAFTKNKAEGGKGGIGRPVYIDMMNGGSRPAGPGGNGGMARGGAIFNSGSLTLQSVTLNGNIAQGGMGGDGGKGFSAQLSGFGKPGKGGAGGNGYGGAIFNSGTYSGTAVTFNGNLVRGGVGGAGGTAFNTPTQSASRGPNGVGQGPNYYVELPVAPAITISGNTGVELSVFLPGTGAQPFTYAIASGTLPEGLQLDPTTGRISGVPKMEAVGQTATYTVSNKSGTSEPGAITFDIKTIEKPSLTVTTLSDTIDNSDDLTSLREAVTYAATLPGSPAILFQNGLAGTVQLGGHALVIEHDMNITGPSNAAITIDGLNEDRILYVKDGHVAVSNLTFTHGSESGILNGASLAMENCAIVSCSGKGGGGGIYNQEKGALVLRNCTVADNSDSGANGGGLCNLGNAEIDSCTFSNNTAPDQGGGIYNSGSLTMSNSIVASGHAAQGPDVFGTLKGDYNLLQNAAGASLSGTHNVTGVDPHLDTLRNNGGPTPTFALGVGSPALDTGLTSLAIDQRGRTRPAGERDDIGAYEEQEVSFGIAGLTLVPTGPKTRDILKAHVQARGTTYKATYTYLWKNNGQVVRTTTKSRSSQDRLDLGIAGNGDRGDLISVEVTVNDGTTANRNATAGAEVTVQNSAPILNQLALQPSFPTPSQTVKASFRGGDVDLADTVTPLYKWRIGSTVLVAEKGSNVDLSKYPQIKPGDIVTVELRLSDGLSASQTLKAALTVVEAPPSTQQKALQRTQIVIPSASAS